MRFSDIPFHPPVATLRWFAALAVVFLAGVAAWQGLVHDRPLQALLLAAAALAAGLAGWLFPQGLRPIFVTWMVLVYPIGWVVSHLILAFLFYCLFTPLGLFFSLTGRDVLARRFPRDQDSFWVDKPAADDIRRYFRQS
jgi:hypothetical protein